MARGKMASEKVLEAVSALLQQAALTGENLNSMGIARRVGCSRTTLYTNPDVRAILLTAGIIEDAPARPAKPEPSSKPAEAKEPSAMERRLRKAEERANRLELLLAEAQEQTRAMQAENESLRMRLRLIVEGRSVL